MFLYGFSSCTCLYEWISIFLWVFVMYMFARMTIHIILVWVFVMYISVQMSIHILIGFVMYMFVWMIIYFFGMGFRHVHVCTNDYPFILNGISSCTFLYKWLSTSLWMGFCHVHLYTNDYPFLLNAFLSCTCLYEWLPFPCVWVCIMHISVRMTIHFFWMGFRHVQSTRSKNVKPRIRTRWHS